MPSPAHETLISLLATSPPLLHQLLVALGLPGIPGALVRYDAVQRGANPVEVRPDLVLATPGPTGSWVLVEVQRAPDPDKCRRWLAATAMLFDARQVMGDLIVLTHDASVAQWAREVARAEGPSGTRLLLQPQVVLLSRTEVDRLLATRQPALAVLATWAIHDQRGPSARRVVRDALHTLTAEPDPALRATLLRAMLSMLGNPLLRVLREMLMLENVRFPVNPALLEVFGPDIEAFVEARALCTVIRARGWSLDATHEARIAACTDSAQLERWIANAVTAPDLDAVFAPTRTP